VLVLLAVICIPWMLVIKPLIINRQHKRSVQADITNEHAEIIQHAVGQGSSSSGDSKGGHGGHGGEEYSFSDIFIHQAIHTIEFCLGCVSHTASYLRLWALSLAHAELSEVLWQMVLSIGFNVRGYFGSVMIYVLFAAFASLTLAILVVMEGLSAFLHALRLHWVEFNSKFYKGEGYAFAPFSFDVILEQARESEEKS